MAKKFFSLFLISFALFACEVPPAQDARIAKDGSYVDEYGGLGSEYGGIGSGELAPGVYDTIYFATDSSSLNSEAREVLRAQAAYLKNNPALDVVIEGHADERATREYNLALGERRANAVKRFLASSGVQSSRISTISYGKERPAVPGTGPESWAQNRRAVTVVR